MTPFLRTLSFALLLLLPLALFGCGERGAGDGRDSHESTQEQVHSAGDGHEHGEHAPATAAVGSHEDWCGEHGVAESACTRCDPELIPAFKAVNDWCVEHGLPESQCLKCNPDLVIARPPKGD